ncbi:HlyD family efflux transporter periplasmic adaptor subunit [Dysosmobacter sp. HCP28S3_G4]|uniref:HlyD family efflux transporter periplasmic adaptor subunit n=1 Tax=Dysosmobacter sp. HCP28S3_G4 TaxID=3438938 RepID=UPI003F8ACA10
MKSKYPRADMSGTVEEVYVQNGDTVSAGTQILKIVGDKNLIIDFLFSYAAPEDFSVGQTATIYVDGFVDTITGTVVGGGPHPPPPPLGSFRSETAQ